MKQIYPVITGYEKVDWKGHKRVVSLYPTYEMWSFWTKGDRRKWKITKWEPRKYGLPLTIGEKDYYGWLCVEILEVVTCVKLDKPRVIYL